MFPHPTYNEQVHSREVYSWKSCFQFVCFPLLLLYVYTGTDVNATDARGVTPLHLALSRLRMLGEGESGKKEGEGNRGVVGMGGGGGSTVPSFRKKEITHVSCHLPLFSSMVHPPL